MPAKRRTALACQQQVFRNWLTFRKFSIIVFPVADFLFHYGLNLNSVTGYKEDKKSVWSNRLSRKSVGFSFSVKKMWSTNKLEHPLIRIGPRYTLFLRNEHLRISELLHHLYPPNRCTNSMLLPSLSAITLTVWKKSFFCGLTWRSFSQ